MKTALRWQAEDAPRQQIRLCQIMSRACRQFWMDMPKHICRRRIAAAVALGRQASLTGRNPFLCGYQSPLGHVTEMIGHVPEIVGHDAESAGYALPKYPGGTTMVRAAPIPRVATASVNAFARRSSKCEPCTRPRFTASFAVDDAPLQVYAARAWMV
ncbi:MAG: hypothetical protein JHC40_21070 [Burkholderiales bacterium]|nr:hypothetical protein [Burkholderiales bacterium]